MLKQLNDSDRSQLAGLVNLPGFKVFQTICENELDHLKLDTFDAKPTDTNEIVARHNRAQAAYIFYQNIVNRANQEIEQFIDKQRMSGEVGPDTTADLFD